MKSISAAMFFFVVSIALFSSCTGLEEEPVAREQKREDLGKNICLGIRAAACLAARDYIKAAGMLADRVIVYARRGKAALAPIGRLQTRQLKAAPAELPI